MCYIDSEERPEEHGRDDIRPISTLELRDDEEDDSECEYRIVKISRNSDIESYIPHKNRDIECCRHDDPAECDIDTRSDDPIC